MTHKPLRRLPEAAEQIGCSRFHIYALMNSGKLCRHFIGSDGQSLARVCQPSIDAYLDATASPVPAA